MLPTCFSSYSFVCLRSTLNPVSEAYNFPIKINSLFEEALFLSSPLFLKTFQNGKKNDNKLKRVFSKYWIRSCTRCTPYGLFAGPTIINITTDESQLVLADNNKHLQSVRIDIDFIIKFVDDISKIPIVRQQLKFFANNSIYKLEFEYRYIEYEVIDNRRKYQITSVACSKYVNRIIDIAAQGATIEDLICLLMSTENVGYDDALAFIEDMCQSQILLSELEVCMTGSDPLDNLILQLEQFHSVSKLVNELKEIKKLISNSTGSVLFYKYITKRFNDLNISTNIPENVLQNDLFLVTKEGHINKEIIETILSQAYDLIFISKEIKNNDLDEFKRKFSARYDNAELPLAVALDPEMGIGYSEFKDEYCGGSGLIDNLSIKQTATQYKENVSNNLEEFILNKYLDYLKGDGAEIEITEGELKGFMGQVENMNFSSGMYIVGSAFKKATKFDKNQFIFDLLGFGVPSASTLMGRFAEGNDEFLDVTREILKFEETEYQDTIYAEIVHIPQARIGKIIHRPLLKKL